MDARESDRIERTIEARETPQPEATIAPEAVRAPGHSIEASMAPGAEVAQLMIPVLDVSASDLRDTFADERGGGSRLHEAMDIMAPAGTSVVAAAPGTIERLFLSDAGGKTVYVRSEDRKTIYYYAHLAEYAPGLNEGQVVRRGQRLGSVGSSGNASPDAPHLHFEVMRTTPAAEWWEPATSVNPYPLLTRRAGR
ncbi:M23 family metallopeptidase [Aurantiacibacter spongiae]|uniref:M23 family metallopeptidase n=2 Tax=Aurantiacibacter spongiae TaxID=2488860 RepID=A0A3N5DTC8_9SPHN|nr:M23 family metallopeptidase [Aurantiacibacter spongiae]